MKSIKEICWGERAKFSTLMWAAALMLFLLLGAKEIWTQEHRWADIVSGMFYRHDFFHPYLGKATYYDKPLLSYWLIAVVAKITGQLNTWVLRLPSALAGLLAIVATYQIGKQGRSRALGLLSAWMLLTTFYFVFWARTSSADMLNLAGTLLAVAWFQRHRAHPSFFGYVIFFTILAITSLCKGLIGAVVPCIIILADFMVEGGFRKHLNCKIILALIPAAVIYVLPFLLSDWTNTGRYNADGLYLVYRENILRYFQPFDHRGPIWTYFLYLPIYTLPWAVVFIPALFARLRNWRGLQPVTRWLLLSCMLLFLFFTASGSRRSYYVLPMVPFALLLTADWVLHDAKKYWQTCCAYLIAISYALLLLIVDIIPAWYYQHVGTAVFVRHLSQVLNPNIQYQYVLLDADAKFIFYHRLPPVTNIISIKEDRENISPTHLIHEWAILKHPPKHAVFVSRANYLPFLMTFLPGYKIVTLDDVPDIIRHLSHPHEWPVALVPNE